MARKNKRLKTEYRKGLGFDPRKYISAPLLHTVHIDDERTPQRGEVWFADLGNHKNSSVQGGVRPVIIVNIPSSVTTLGEKAFVDQDITSVVLPDTLTTLGTYIFMGCRNLSTARVECAEIPAFCFIQCGLTSLTLSHNVTKLNSNILNYTALHELIYEGSLEDWAAVTKYSNWDNNSVDTHGLDKVVCLDGYMEYDRENREWKAVKE